MTPAPIYGCSRLNCFSYYQTERKIVVNVLATLGYRQWRSQVENLGGWNRVAPGEATGDQAAKHGGYSSRVRGP